MSKQNVYTLESDLEHALDTATTVLHDELEIVKTRVDQLVSLAKETEQELDDQRNLRFTAEDNAEITARDLEESDEQMSKVGISVGFIVYSLSSGNVANAVSELNDLVRLLSLDCEKLNVESFPNG